MKHTISHNQEVLNLFGDLLDCFYNVSVTRHGIKLQAEFSKSLIAKLELFGAVFTLDDDFYRATIERFDTKITFVIEAEEN